MNGRKKRIQTEQKKEKTKKEKTQNLSQTKRMRKPNET